MKLSNADTPRLSGIHTSVFVLILASALLLSGGAAHAWTVTTVPPVPAVTIFASRPASDNGCTNYRYRITVTATGMCNAGGWDDVLFVSINGTPDWPYSSSSSPSSGGGRTEVRQYDMTVAPGGALSIAAEVWLESPTYYYEPPARATAYLPVYAPQSASCPTGPLTLPMNGACISSTVEFSGGNFFHETPLFQTRGIGPQVRFSLMYNSADPLLWQMGPGWMHSYNSRIVSNADGSRLLIGGDGRRILFRETATAGTYAPQANFGRSGDMLQQFADGTFLWTEKDGTRHDYAGNGRRLAIRDRNGLALTMGYSGSGLLSSITDATGRTTTLSYDLSGRLVRVTDPAGHAATLGYGFWGDLERITDAEGQSTAFGYSGGRMASLTDPAGNVNSYAYDEAGWLAGVTDASGLTTELFHEPESLRSTVLGRNGGMTTTWYDGALVAPVTVIGADNGVTRYGYDSNRNLLWTVGPAGDNTSHTYDASGNRLTTTDVLGQTTTYTYNGFGQTTSVAPPEGGVTTLGYDTAGNLTSATDANGATTTVQYDGQGKVTQVTRPGNRVTRFTYDSYGNVASVTDPAGLVTTATHDLLGNVTSVTDPNGATTTFGYDNVSRLVRVTDPLGRPSVYTYDANGNRATGTDPLGHVTRFEHNPQNMLSRVTDALGHATVYDYSYGNCGSCGGGGDLLASLADPLGNTTRFEYDVMGNRTRSTDPLGASEWLDYDEAGRLIGRIDANGRTTDYVHDLLSRVRGVLDPANVVTSFDYTPSGQTDNVIDGNGNRTHYAYDNVGRLVRTESPDAGTTSYGYNPDGTPATRTDANGTTTTYGYDNASRLTHIGFPDSAQDVSFGYDAPASSFGKGRLTGMTDPTGTTTYHYDALGRIVQEQKVALGVAYAIAYAYDNAGNISSTGYPGGRTVTSTFDALHRPTGVATTLNGTPADLASSFIYDNASRLTGYTLGNGLTVGVGYDAAGRPLSIATPGVTNRQFAYDPAGQIVWMTDGVQADPSPPPDNTAYGYSANRLATITQGGGTQTYGYDNTGNTTSDASRTFVYNQDQRLAEVWQGAVKLQENGYDGKGRRVVKRAGTATTVFHYDQGNRLIAESDASGTVQVEYVWLGGAPLAQIRKQGTTESVYFYHTDHLGTPKAMTDNTQAVVWRVETDPFGNEIGTSIKTVENNLRFPGQYYDQETGLNQNYFRDYDPKTGRYPEADPIGLAGGMNPYVYVYNMPTMLTDENGLVPKDKWYGHKDKDFHKYYHRCYKPKAGIRGNGTREDIEEAHAEWLAAGKPKGGKCGGKTKDPCSDKETADNNSEDNRNFSEQLRDAWNNFSDWFNQPLPGHNGNGNRSPYLPPVTPPVWAFP